MQKRTAIIAATIVGLMAGSTSAQAVLLVYEGFDYTAGALAGNNGGTGFVAGSSYSTSGTGVSVESESLSYPSFYPGVGNHLVMAPSQHMNAGRGWGTETKPSAGSEYWYSFLLKPVNGAKGTLVPFSGTLSNDNGQNGFGMRMDNADNATTLVFKTWSPGQWDGGSTNNISIANGYGNTYLIVGKLFVSADGINTTNTIWVNPTLGVVPTTGGVSVTTNSQDYVTRLSGRAFSGSAGMGMHYDELRIGTTAMDVMAVPEPSSMALLGLGALALLRRKRNKN